MFLGSVTPLLVDVAAPAAGPFLFQFWLNVAHSAIWLTVLWYACPSVALDRAVWSAAVTALRSPAAGWGAVLNGFSWTADAGAARFIDTAAVEVVAAGWLLLFIASRQRNDRRHPPPSPLRSGTW